MTLRHRLPTPQVARPIARATRIARAALLALATLALIVASPSSIHVHAQGPDRGTVPKPTGTPTLKLPSIQKRALSNGLPVWLVELHEVPIVQLNLLIMSGSADDPVGQYGIARMTAAMLENGAGSRSALEIADAIDFLGADLTSTSGIDASAVRLNVPVARLKDALDVMADVALRPTFPSTELERLRKETLISLLQARDDAPTVAQLALSRAVYGPTHRFGTASVGTADTVKSFTPGDLRTFYAAHYRPEQATLVVVGDTTLDAAMPLLEAAFGAWKPQGPPAARVMLPAVQPAAQRVVYLVDKPGAPQSQIRIGGIGVARPTPDYFPIVVMNTVLGGSFSSRLNLNLREEHGYSYGAYSVFDMRQEPGPFFAYAGVQTDKTVESLKEFFKELDGIREPIPGQELTRAKNYVALSFPEEFETTGDIAGNLETLRVYGLPDAFFSTYVPNIESVTVSAAQQMAQKYIRPDRFAVIVVGDLEKIEPGIRALNLGPIKTMQTDELFGR